MLLVELGRVCTHRINKKPMIITSILDDKFVVAQDTNGERNKLTVSQLLLKNEVIKIKQNDSVDEVKKVFAVKENNVIVNDFERFKIRLMERIKDDIIKSKIN